MGIAVGLDGLFQANRNLNELEFGLQHLYLRSMPRYVTIVLGNECNLSCRHCYQSKNGDHLFRNPQIASELRREFSGLYPYISTIRFQGGEVLALDGFRELIDDVEASVNRPVISISTNGTLLDEKWAQLMVQMPFQEITFSIDGGTAATFQRLRHGARLDGVIDNLRRVQETKKRLNSPLPKLNVFYVVMRSNYREIPQFLELMKSLEIEEIAFQMILTDERNLLREPALIEESIDSLEDVARLRDILQEVMNQQAGNFRRFLWSGFRSLFERYGLNPSFLGEEVNSLYPGREESGVADPIPAAEDLSQRFPAATEKMELCPNPWSLMLVAENGDVSICFMSEPIGNLFEMPLIEIWNSPRAIAKRSEMIAGRYLSSGCSSLWCAWREGKVCDTPDAETWRKKLAIFRSIVQRMEADTKAQDSPEVSGEVNAVRRLLKARNDRIQELEAVIADLWEKNGHLHNKGQAYITHLESVNRELRSMVYANPVVSFFSIISMYAKRLLQPKRIMSE